MDTHTIPPDPVAIIRQVTPDQLRNRLRDLDAQRRMVLILLRAANADLTERRKAVTA
jgi:hypothetical protein